MSDILCVTNQALCAGAFLERIEAIAAAHPAGILLREKDLGEDAYRSLAERVLAICRRHGTPCILHSFVGTAADLGCKAVHLPLPVLRTLTAVEKAPFERLGASCHSAAEALEAERLGCTYLTAGHIFDTDCKRGTPGRGLAFLEAVCAAVSLPVYAIGGIRPENIAAVRRSGVAGACVMSGVMTCNNVRTYLGEFQ